MSTQTFPPLSTARQLLNKVPEVTIYFWLIKCLCTTIGETMSDNLMTQFAVGGDNASPDQLQMALYKVAGLTVVLLIVLLTIQFRLRRYVPFVYWSNIVVISVLGTQITDMFEGQGDQPQNMWAITIVSVTLLAGVFFAWWYVERTLSMHSIRTVRREAFYWLAILTTFATGTAVGDLIAEKFNMGYLTTLEVFIATIAIIAAVWKFTPINGVLAFWLAYIMTRPLGASTGDWLSQQGNQGLNWGTTNTSYLFLAIIIALVVYLQVKKPDVTPVELMEADEARHPDHPYGYQEGRGYGDYPRDPRYAGYPQDRGFAGAPQGRGFAGSQQGFGGYPEDRGYAGQPQGGGFAGQQQGHQGYGNQPQGGSYGNQGYGNQRQPSGYGPPQGGSYGNQPQHGGYGNQPQPSGFGNQAQPGGYGNQPPAGGYGDYPQDQGYRGSSRY